MAGALSRRESDHWVYDDIVSAPLLKRRLRSKLIPGLSLFVLVVFTPYAVSAATKAGAPWWARVVSTLVPLLFLVIGIAFARLEVLVHDTPNGRSLEVHYGFGLLKQRFPAATIESATTVSQSMIEMGGLGYRGSLRVLRYAALVTRGGPALELQLTNRRRFLVTVDQPEDFVAALGK